MVVIKKERWPTSTKKEVIDAFLSLLENLSEEERLEIFHCFCVYCGKIQNVERNCQCANDE